MEYPNQKFVKIVATRCIENFPDRNLPCIIIYKDGNYVHNIPNFDKLKQTTPNCTKNNLKKVFMDLEVFEKEEIDSDEVKL